MKLKAVPVDIKTFLRGPGEMRTASPRDIRQLIREDRFVGNTSGFSLGYLQGNLVILSEQVTNIKDLWRDDFITFVLGCSYTFEHALMNEGVRLRHIDEDKTVPMYCTNIQTTPAGPFSGSTVVSMRSLSVEKAIRAIEITSRFPQAHGAPIHFGDAKEIGIKDLSKPDWGDPTEIRTGEVPVFWACGVTPQAAIQNAKPSICITHAPGNMLITDISGMDAGRGSSRSP
jgi:uncharacterized protein YcsI (UPF0317 family)